MIRLPNDIWREVPPSQMPRRSPQADRRSERATTGRLFSVLADAFDQSSRQGDPLGAWAVGPKVRRAEVGAVDEDGELAREPGSLVRVEAACSAIKPVEERVTVLPRDPSGRVIVVVVLGGRVAERAPPEAGASQIVLDPIEKRVQGCARVFSALDVPVDQLQDPLGQPVEIGADQFVLGREHPVDAHLAQAGLRDQSVHPDRMDSVGREQPSRSVQNDSAALVDGKPSGASGALPGRTHPVSVATNVTDPSQHEERVECTVPARW